ncbi:MAG: T9SS type A sorting domain-containing protein [Chlorobi bacterium]|nr:T9SS type A sorting domain-containing protein [Chlorobiota bacterium]
MKNLFINFLFKNNTTSIRRITAFAAVMISISAYSQDYMIYDINFEDTSQFYRIKIDTNSNQNNIWEIGEPRKNKFSSSISLPNAIITDSVNPYPINDTSSFTITHLTGDGWNGYPKIDIGGWYYVDSDTLSDYGFVEYSANHGNSWILIDSANGNCCTWGATIEPAVFTGNSNGWRHFYYCICSDTILNINDTILYKFTFLSDSIQSNKDGLMFDNLHFEDWAEGVDEFEDQAVTKIFPNPARRNVTFNYSLPTNQKNGVLSIFDNKGQIIEQFNLSNLQRQIIINTSALNSGVYFYTFIAGKQITKGKFVIL